MVVLPEEPMLAYNIDARDNSITLAFSTGQLLSVTV